MLDRRSGAVSQAKLKNYIEMATNVAVLLVALTVLGVFALNYFSRRSTPQLQAGLQKGQVFARVAGVNYDTSSQTLLIAMSTKCHYCAESLPFYRQLAEAQRSKGQHVNVVAVFPNNEDEVRQYAQRNSLALETVAGVKLATLNISGTPTAVLIDNGGRVIDFWVGKQPPETEQQILKAVSGA
jgi:thiol-disulfide isomerase/thioredoxin